jgi:hypothetical protein
LGPINLAAIQEHQELDERYRFLTTQEQDLSTAISSLKEIIQRINRTTKDMFASTFAELQQKFGEVFVKFFPGGRAELQLVEVLADETAEGRGSQEPGVDIVVQPPGKRLKSITMLSGGEKTLTAMALLFASRHRSVYSTKSTRRWTKRTSGVSQVYYVNSPKMPSSWSSPTTSGRWSLQTRCLVSPWKSRASRKSFR